MEPWSDHYKKKCIETKNIEATIGKLKDEGKTIVSLNGSFDLMHAGHLHIIFQASQYADILVVALNTDDSIRRYKNPLRPIVTLRNRMQMMAALSFVDYVTSFDETDPRQVLEQIKPDVHVNGSEYGENCIESETVKKYGGRIQVVSLVPSLSTSQIVDKIVKMEQAAKT